MGGQITFQINQRIANSMWLDACPEQFLCGAQDDDVLEVILVAVTVLFRVAEQA